MFGRKLSPLKYAEVVRALRMMGYFMRPKTGTAHEHWILTTPARKYLVTVDKHLAPFSRDLIKLMAQQAGMKTRHFHALCKGSCTLQDIELEPGD